MTFRINIMPEKVMGRQFLVAALLRCATLATIKTDPLRQAYVVAQELGHVEQANEPGIHVLYNWMAEQGTRRQQAYENSASRGIHNSTGLGLSSRPLMCLA